MNAQKEVGQSKGNFHRSVNTEPTSSVKLNRTSRRKELIEHSNGSLRDTVCLLGIYAAYLVGAQDGRFRDAYDLLYRVELFAEEARKKEHRREAAGKINEGSTSGRDISDDLVEDESSDNE